LQTGETREGAAKGRESAADGGQKRARSLPAGPWKFLERMPERPDRYAERPFISQVRKAQLLLHFLQLGSSTVEK
jgi:hypothetical protein